MIALKSKGKEKKGGQPAERSRLDYIDAENQAKLCISQGPNMKKFLAEQKTALNQSRCGHLSSQAMRGKKSISCATK
jgi:hypothetical protein